MSTVQEIGEALLELSPADLEKVRALLAELVVSKMRALETEHGRSAIERARQREEQLSDQIEQEEKSLPDLRNFFIDDLANSKSSMPHPVVQPAKYQSIDEWLAAFRKWGESHKDITAIADDSRESIY